LLCTTEVAHKFNSWKKGIHFQQKLTTDLCKIKLQLSFLN
jgi:hypothetical protein